MSAKHYLRRGVIAHTCTSVWRGALINTAEPWQQDRPKPTPWRKTVSQRLFLGIAVISGFSTDWITKDERFIHRDACKPKTKSTPWSTKSKRANENTEWKHKWKDNRHCNNDWDEDRSIYTQPDVVSLRQQQPPLCCSCCNFRLT